MANEVDVSQLAIERKTESSAPRRGLWSRYVLPAALLAGFAAVLFWATRDLLVPAAAVEVVPVVVTEGFTEAGEPLFNAAGWIEPRPTPIRVAALAPGVVEELLVVEDQEVQAGEPVAQLVKDDAKLALDSARAALQLRQAELTETKAALEAAQTRFEQPAHLEAPLAEAGARLARVETALAQLPFQLRAAEARQDLTAQELKAKESSKDVVSGVALDRAKSNHLEAIAATEELKQRQKSLTAEQKALRTQHDALAKLLELKTDEGQALGEATGRVAAGEAQVELARVAVAEAELRLNRMTVRAPVAGRVLHLVGNPGAKLGDNMGADPRHDGRTVVSLYQPHKLQVRVDVRFENLQQVQIGQPVRIEIPAVPEPMSGRVLFLSSLADIQKNTLEVKVGIDDPPPVLKPEMLVDVTFLAIGERGSETEEPLTRLRLWIPSLLVGRDGTETHVWVADQTSGSARRRTVRLGSRRGDLVEVLDGLNPASRVIATGREDLTDGSRIRVTGTAAQFQGASAEPPAQPSGHQPAARHGGQP